MQRLVRERVFVCLCFVVVAADFARMCMTVNNFLSAIKHDTHTAQKQTNYTL